MKSGKIRIPALFFFMALAFTSCVIDEDIDPDDGDVRDKFIGSRRFTETEGFKSDLGISYTVTITYDPGNSSQVLLRNFANAGGNYSAYGVVTSNRITVPAQEIAPGFLVSGSGSSSGQNLMNWDYTIAAGGDQNYYTASASRQ